MHVVLLIVRQAESPNQSHVHVALVEIGRASRGRSLDLVWWCSSEERREVNQILGEIGARNACFLAVKVCESGRSR